VHILIVPSERFIPFDDPLSGIFQYDQAMALHRLGIKVGVIAISPKYGINFFDRIRGFSRKYTIDNSFPFPTVTSQSSVLWPGRFIRLMQFLLDRIGINLFRKYVEFNGMPDLIHAHNVLFAGCFSMMLMKNYGIPYVITEHSSIFLNDSMKINKRIIAAHRHACARIVVSRFLGKILESKIGKEATPWDWVPNILPAAFETANSENKFSKKRFRFLCIAQFVPVKNHLCLLKAFAEGFSGCNAELFLGGDGPLLPSIKKIARQLGISSQVIFLGLQSRKQVLKEMQQCDVVVLPSHHETFGVVLIEAMSCGKPVIGPSGSGPDDIINKDNGILFRPNNSNSLAAAMKNLFENHGNYDPNTIRSNCLACYGEKAIISRLIAIYNRVQNKNNNATK
jgi:glycosyltransferase involved in cell wall biosynthesis